MSAQLYARYSERDPVKKIYTHYNAYLEARSQVATELDDVRLGHSK